MKSPAVCLSRGASEIWSYQDKQFVGLEAFCLQRKEDRVFRVDRILEMKIAKE